MRGLAGYGLPAASSNVGYRGGMRRPLRLVVAVVMALVAASALGIAMAALLVFTTSNLAAVAPEEKARVLGRTISEAMSCVAMFPVFTLPVAIFMAWTGADARTTARVALAALAGLLAAFGATVAWGNLSGRVPTGASDAQRVGADSSAVAVALYDGALLAMLTVSGAAAIAWRTRKRVDA